MKCTCWYTEASESTVNIAILVSCANSDLERTREQSCSHLTKNERALLDSCVNDAAFLRRDGKIKWDEIPVKFSEMASDVTIFCRSRKRLRSSSKSFQEVSKIRMKLSTPPPLFTSEPTDEPLLTPSSSVVRQNPSNTTHVNLSTVVEVAPTYARTKRMDNLDELERLFVQDFGKKCLTLKQTVDSNRLLHAYMKQFPTFFRDALTLKNYWINYVNLLRLKNFLTNK